MHVLYVQRRPRTGTPARRARENQPLLGDLHMKKSMQKGFTLIELMIVVAIVAILAAIALPAYTDYMKRSKVSEAMAAAGACKTSVAEYAASTNTLPADEDVAGCATT